MLRAQKQTRGVKQMVIVFPRHVSLPSRLKGDRSKRGNEEREEGGKGGSKKVFSTKHKTSIACFTAVRAAISQTLYRTVCVLPG